MRFRQFRAECPSTGTEVEMRCRCVAAPARVPMVGEDLSAVVIFERVVVAGDMGLPAMTTLTRGFGHDSIIESDREREMATARSRGQSVGERELVRDRIRLLQEHIR